MSTNPRLAAAARRRALHGSAGNDLEYKRSFFVRMVSDPKMYNPKIVANTFNYANSNSLTVAITTQDKKDMPSSWISWPLGLLLQGVFDDHSTARLRFRNWDTKVTLKPPGSNHYNSSRPRSKSPNRDIDSTGSSRSESPEKY